MFPRLVDIDVVRRDFGDGIDRNQCVLLTDAQESARCDANESDLVLLVIDEQSVDLAECISLGVHDLTRAHVFRRINRTLMHFFQRVDPPPIS